MMKQFSCLLLLLPLTMASKNNNTTEEEILAGWGKDGELNFGHLGKLNIKDLTDKNRSPPYPPQKPEKINVRFYLLRKGKGKKNITGLTAKSDPKNFGINPNQPAVIIVHGFKASGNDPWLKDIGKKIRSIRKKDNIIIVDWKEGASGDIYYLPERQYRQAASNAWTVGGQIWKVCQNLNKHFEISYEAMHIIGHSLGSHAAGYAGSRLKGQLGRISALDAAKPEFEGTKPSIRIDPTDAKFVDSIHTDISRYRWLPVPSGFGMKEPVGHVDFYPNGGEVQPGVTTRSGIVSKGAIGERHSRAYELYAQSIVSPCSFLAYKCDNYEDYSNGKCNSCGQDGSKCAKMGFFANTFKNPEGVVNQKFYLLTSDSPPFCVHHYSVELVLKKRPVHSGKIIIALYGAGKTHAFKMAITDSGTVNQITGSREKLGIVEKLDFVCLVGTLCNRCRLQINKIVIKPLTESIKSPQASSTVICVPQKECIGKKKKYTFLGKEKC